LSGKSEFVEFRGGECQPSYAAKDQFPWTYLGYKFDWAQKEDSGDLITFGESEFIVPAGTGISFLSATDTATYGKP
jgi:hypothetical protein